MVGWSAAAATVTTLLMGALSDRARQAQSVHLRRATYSGDSRPPLSATLHLRTRGGFSPRRTPSAAAAVMVVVLDCVMTFFGSNANDAAFNAYVTDITDSDNRGRVESVLAILPLISMLIIFGGFDGLTQQGKWREFFNIFGVSVSVVGLVSLVLIKDSPRLTPRRDSYFKNLLYGLRPSVVRENPQLYLSLRGFQRFLDRRAGVLPIPDNLYPELSRHQGLCDSPRRGADIRKRCERRLRADLSIGSAKCASPCPAAAIMLIGACGDVLRARKCRSYGRGQRDDERVHDDVRRTRREYPRLDAKRTRPGISRASA